MESERAQQSSPISAQWAARVPEPYHAYAPHYDRQGLSQWSLTLVEFLQQELLPRFGNQPRTLLDLACGTGSAALAFASAGYQVVGLDRSAAMLAEARRKATATATVCAFIRADLRAFAFQRPFDLITCCYDSLNYLLSHADLVTACHQVRAALAPRGLFVADLTTAHAYAHEPPTPTTFDLGDIAYGWQTAWHPTSQQATTTLTVTTRHSNNSSTVTERHQQRAYAPAEVTDALHASGLQLLAALAVSPQQVPTLLPPTADTARIIYVATPMAEEQ